MFQLSVTMSHEGEWPTFGCTLCGDKNHTSFNCSNTLQACTYCGGPLLTLTKMCSCCGIDYSKAPDIPAYAEVTVVLCKICGSRPAIIDGMCEYCNFFMWRREQGDEILCVKCSFNVAGVNGICQDCAPPPGYTQVYKEAGPSNRLTPWVTMEDCNETRYGNPYGSSPSPQEGEAGNYEIESVGSCDWIVIPSDSE